MGATTFLPFLALVVAVYFWLTKSTRPKGVEELPGPRGECDSLSKALSLSARLSQQGAKLFQKASQFLETLSISHVPLRGSNSRNGVTSMVQYSR